MSPAADEGQRDQVGPRGQREPQVPRCPCRTSPRTETDTLAAAKRPCGWRTGRPRTQALDVGAPTKPLDRTATLPSSISSRSPAAPGRAASGTCRRPSRRSDGHRHWYHHGFVSPCACALHRTVRERPSRNLRALCRLRRGKINEASQIRKEQIDTVEARKLIRKEAASGP